MKRGALMSISMLIKAMLNLAALVVFTRILTPQEYGTYSLVITLVLLADAMLFTWLRFGYTRYFSTEYGPRYVKNVIILSIISAFLCLAIVCALRFGEELLPRAWAIGSLWFVVGAVMVGEGIFNLQLVDANNRRREADFLSLSLVKSFGSLFAGWTLVAFGLGVEGVLLGQLVGYGLSILLLLRRLCHFSVGSLLTPDFALMKALLVIGLPMAAMQVLEMIINLGTRTSLITILGSEALSVYTIANDIVQKLIVFLMLTLNTASLPMVVKALESEGDEAARRSLSRNAAILFGLTIPASVGMVLLAPQLTQVLVGEAFRAPVLSILPWFVLIALPKGAVSFYLAHSFYLAKTSHRMIKPMLAITVVGLVIFHIGVTLFGMIGAIGTMISIWSVYGLVVGLRGRREFVLPLPFLEFARALAGTAVMVAAVWPFRAWPGFVGLFGGATVGVAVYALVAIALDLAGTRALVLRALGHQK
ncbi:lipopolysaccharide biosynthesis protein [Rhodoplanes sp. SY1]|uniref:lipopolysaccharide biosynthesis protein n=1 Tax=Rhodoplanes sp. SY1 TaxID=3166646 RepID=UPI0038B42BB2